MSPEVKGLHHFTAITGNPAKRYRMKINEMDRDQGLSIILILGVLFGLLGLPLVLQHFYGVDAIKAAFGVIVVYALLNWHLQNKNN